MLISLSLKRTIVTSADLISLVGYLENSHIDSLTLNSSIFSDSDM
jgi:hypothetical protein